MVQPLPKMQSNPLAAIQAFTQPRRNQLAGLASGLLSANDWGQGLSAGFAQAAQGRQVDDAYATSQKDAASRQEQLQKTITYLRSQPGGSIWADAAERGNVESKDAFKGWYDSIQGAENSDSAPANVQEWKYFSTLTPEQQSQYLVMKRSVPFLDQGTQYGRPDPLTGKVGPVVAKDNFTPAYDAASGTATAKGDVENKVAYESLNSKLPGLKSVVSELGDLAEKATYTTAGKLWDDVVRETGNLPTDGALARTKYMSMVDNQVLPLLRDTFGAAFTVSEGESLRATLGAPDKSPAEKKAVLEAFIEQKTRDLEALQSRLPGRPDAAAPNADVEDILKGFGL